MRKLTVAIASALLLGVTSVGAMAASPSSPAASGQGEGIHEGYSVGDGVKVEWNGRWYQAKVMEKKADRYKITYLGWDSRWDEWVTPARMKKSA